MGKQYNRVEKRRRRRRYIKRQKALKRQAMQKSK